MDNEFSEQLLIDRVCISRQKQQPGITKSSYIQVREKL